MMLGRRFFAAFRDGFVNCLCSDSRVPFISFLPRTRAEQQFNLWSEPPAPQNSALAIYIDISDNTPSRFPFGEVIIALDWIVRRRRSASDKGRHFSAALSWNPKLEKVTNEKVADASERRVRRTRRF